MIAVAVIALFVCETFWILNLLNVSVARFRKEVFSEEIGPTDCGETLESEHVRQLHKPNHDADTRHVEQQHWELNAEEDKIFFPQPARSEDDEGDDGGHGNVPRPQTLRTKRSDFLRTSSEESMGKSVLEGDAGLARRGSGGGDVGSVLNEVAADSERVEESGASGLELLLPPENFLSQNTSGSSGEGGKSISRGGEQSRSQSTSPPATTRTGDALGQLPDKANEPMGQSGESLVAAGGSEIEREFASGGRIAVDMGDDDAGKGEVVCHSDETVAVEGAGDIDKGEAMVCEEDRKGSTEVGVVESKKGEMPATEVQESLQEGAPVPIATAKIQVEAASSDKSCIGAASMATDEQPIQKAYHSLLLFCC